MITACDEDFWNELLPRIHEGEVIPIVGPGAVTFGLGDELLYPALALRLPAELDPPLQMDKPPRDLQDVIDAQRAQGQPVERIYKRLHKMVEDADLRPGATLAALAAVEAVALKNYREALVVREKLTQQDQTNAHWQGDLAVTCWRTGSTSLALDPKSKKEAIKLIERAREILRELKTHASLTAEQQSWLDGVEADLAKLHEPK